jgi:hypothetical protein
LRKYKLRQTLFAFIYVLAAELTILGRTNLAGAISSNSLPSRTRKETLTRYTQKKFFGTGNALIRRGTQTLVTTGTAVLAFKYGGVLEGSMRTDTGTGF